MFWLSVFTDVYALSTFVAFVVRLLMPDTLHDRLPRHHLSPVPRCPLADLLISSSVIIRILWSASGSPLQHLHICSALNFHSSISHCHCHSRQPKALRANHSTCKQIKHLLHRVLLHPLPLHLYLPLLPHRVVWPRMCVVLN